MPSYVEEYSCSSEQDQDASYFEGYSDLGVHQIMLSDTPRMSFYYTILTKPGIVGPSSVVIDVGCGTGVLSMWAAGARTDKTPGAARVISIEASRVTAQLATTVAHDNGISATLCSLCTSEDGHRSVFSTSDGEPLEEQIAFIQATAEQVVEWDVFEFINAVLPRNENGIVLPVSHIVSEWMGFYLLHESMLSSVLHIKNFILKVNQKVAEMNQEILKTKSSGVVSYQTAVIPQMIPDAASLYVSPVTLEPYFEKEYSSFWSRVTPLPGAPLLNMQAVGRFYFEAQIATVLETGAPLVAALNPEISPNHSLDGAKDVSGSATCLLHEPVELIRLDLQTLPVACTVKPDSTEMSAESITGSATFNFAKSQLSRNCAENLESKGGIDGFALWFNVYYTHSGHTFSLRTGPNDAATHWKQSILLLPAQVRPIPLETLVKNEDEAEMTINVNIKKGEERNYEIQYELS